MLFLAGLIDCSQHRSKCYDPAWYKVMMAACEQTCGFCAADRCFDAAEGCMSLRILCNQPQYTDIMRHQCTRTCGRCGSSSSTGSLDAALGTGDGNEQIVSSVSIAPTAQPFVFTPATPTLTTSTPRPPPTKEIVVVVRPGPKTNKCYDKSATCEQHKKLCNNWVRKQKLRQSDESTIRSCRGENFFYRAPLR